MCAMLTISSRTFYFPPVKSDYDWKLSVLNFQRSLTLLKDHFIVGGEERLKAYIVVEH